MGCVADRTRYVALDLTAVSFLRSGAIGRRQLSVNASRLSSVKLNARTSFATRGDDIILGISAPFILDPVPRGDFLKTVRIDVTLGNLHVMNSTHANKVSLATASRGPHGQLLLASGTNVGMRAWHNEEPGDPKPVTTREYETLGYVLAGRAELHVGGDVLELEAGDSYLVPRGVAHTYHILETFSAVEATSPRA